MSLLDNKDLSGVNLNPPVLVGLVRCSVMQLEEKDDGQLHIKLKTQAPAKDYMNADVPAGYETTDRIRLVPFKGWTQQHTDQALGRFQVAALNIPAPTVFSPVSQYEGKLVDVVFEADPQGDGRVYQRVKRYNAVKS